jgi:hypothetical protein
MAQWMGQFSGRTHETKVQDIEETLRKAIKAFDVVPDAEREPKLKAIRHLAERLLVARSKMLRGRMSKLGLLNNREQESQLRLREQNLHSQGVTGILREFGFNENT